MSATAVFSFPFRSHKIDREVFAFFLFSLQINRLTFTETKTVNRRTGKNKSFSHAESRQMQQNSWETLPCQPIDAAACNRTEPTCLHCSDHQTNPWCLQTSPDIHRFLLRAAQSSFYSRILSCTIARLVTILFHRHSWKTNNDFHFDYRSWTTISTSTLDNYQTHFIFITSTSPRQTHQKTISFLS